MPTRRLKATVPEDVANYAEARARALGCTISSLAEAFLRVDMAKPIEELAVRVAEVEKRLEAEREARGRIALEGARAVRWPEKASGEDG